MSTEITTHPNQDQINKLRRLADFLEAHPFGKTFIESEFIGIYFDDVLSMLAAKKALGGSWSKIDSPSYFSINREIGELTITLKVARGAVCTRRTVTKTLPAVEAQPERVIEVEEWDCPKSILQIADQAEAEAA